MPSSVAPARKAHTGTGISRAETLAARASPRTSSVVERSLPSLTKNVWLAASGCAAQTEINGDEDECDPRIAYRRAEVVIAPLLASAGTNIKIMEAMAMGKAIVSTESGIHGLTLERGRDVVVTDDPLTMAKEIERLFDDPEHRKRIERSARRTAELRYDWDAIAEQQKKLYDTLREP